MAKTETPTIPSLRDDPKYVKAADLAAAFQDRMSALDIELRRLRLLQRSAPDEQARRDQQRALAALPQSAAATMPVVNKNEDLPPVIRRGLQILAGEIVEYEEPAKKIARLERDRRDLWAAQVAAVERAEEIRGELTFKAAKLLQRHHSAMLRRILECAEELAQASAAERSFRDAFIAAGFIDRADLLPYHGIAAAYALGHPSQHDSQVAREHRRLKDLGIL